MTVPGHLVSLGAEEDWVAADALVDIARVCARMRESSNGSVDVMRNALWSFWEKPRLPGALLDSVYPLRFPWSPAARMVYDVGGARPPGGRGLVLEHVAPRGTYSDGFISLCAGSERTMNHDKAIAFLLGIPAFAVITKAEDRMFGPAGVRDAAPKGSTDIWVRYRIAGMDPDTFAPIVLT